MGENTEIVVIDSGVDVLHDRMKNVNIIRLRLDKNRMKIVEDITDDELGHGTAVCGILVNHCKSVKITMIKTFDEKQDYANYEEIVYILKYIYENINCKIINMSLGLAILEDQKELEQICYRFYKRGVLIVAAFSNSGSMSFPAAFGCTVGVTSDDTCEGGMDYKVYNDEVVNVGAYGKSQRVLCSFNQTIINKGDSLACAHFSGIILNMMKTYKKSALDIVKHLNIRLGINNENVKKNRNDFVKMYKNVIIFPINKETINLIRYQRLLSFDIVGVYDYKYLGRIGSKVSLYAEIQGYDYTIEDIEKVDMNIFDTIVIGHVGKLWKFNLQKLLEKMIVAKKNIYAFDNLSSYKNAITSYTREYLFYPSRELEDIYRYMKIKLYRIGKPVLGIFGTSSQQGKYTLQLYLREWFFKQGYKIGQLGTEPSAYLFNMDACFHFGYMSEIEMKNEEIIMYTNGLMNDIAREYDVDLIMIGGQSLAVPQDWSTIDCFPMNQIAFILGTQPDAVVLCINYEDDIQYIYRTKAFLESIVECKVLALVMRPIKNGGKKLGYEKLSALEETDISKHKELLWTELRLPLYILENGKDMNELGERIVDYFR